ncbi:hypothetical protein [Cupriavidus malaysiensis]|uniref:hypothetical protein n=1 Tax=Cupriavidus malaysiensis TaxID=367825 RepID=UPI0012FF9A95|nr:hypothetical protein [Cupriavidus malaysiensis]
MSVSHSLLVGRSYLPTRAATTANFINRTASRIRSNPAIAADIMLAAADQLLKDCRSEADLRGAFEDLVTKSCKARDTST